MRGSNSGAAVLFLLMSVAACSQGGGSTADSSTTTQMSGDTSGQDTSPTAPDTSVHEVQKERCNCYTLSEVDLGGDGLLTFTILDERTRNLTLDDRVGLKIETLSPRPIYVAAILPTEKQGWGMVVNGVYRVGSLPQGLPPAGVVTSIPQFWVGFPMLEAANPRFEDIPNHAGDISLLLDVIEENPDIFGEIDTSRTLYSGNSAGAISGLLFSNSCCIDPRIKGVVAVSGLMLDEAFGFDFPYDFDAGPEVLAFIGVNDDVIPYSYSSRLIARSSKVEVLSIIAGGHNDDIFSFCPQAQRHMNEFIGHIVYGSDRPIFSGDCASSERLPGGSTDIGGIGQYLAGS